MTTNTDNQTPLSELYQKTADELGLPIYSSDPSYVWDKTLQRYLSMVKNGLDTGCRSFALRGPQGTGKNSFVYELSAMLGMPVYEVDFSAGDDLEMLLGTTGLKDGNTITEEGKLTEAACRPGGAIVVFNEVVEAPRGQLTAIHNMVGSGMNVDNRFITIKSTGATLDGKAPIKHVDPNTIFFATWNPDRTDRRPHPAFEERFLSLTFEYPDEKDEIARVGAQVYRALYPIFGANMEPAWNYNPDKRGPATKDNPDGIPVPVVDQVPFINEHVAPVVRFVRSLRDQYHNDQLAHCPGMRTMVRFANQYILEKWSGATAEAQANAAETALQILDGFLDQSIKHSVRKAKLHKLASTHFNEIPLVATE